MKYASNKGLERWGVGERSGPEVYYAHTPTNQDVLQRPLTKSEMAVQSVTVVNLAGQESSLTACSCLACRSTLRTTGFHKQPEIS